MNVTDLFHTPDLTAVAAVPRRRRSRRALIVCGALLLAAAGGITFTLLRSSQGGATAEVNIEQARVQARKTLSAFLAASTPEKRAELVIGGDRMLPLMQAYYAGRELDKVHADDFQPASWSFNETPDMVALELPRGRALSTVVACLKKSDGRWLMDWETWTQTMDGGFRGFLNRPAEGEHTLRVRLTSSAVSPDEVKLDVADPFNTGSSLTLEITRPDLTALYVADLPAGTTRTATVQLVWLNDSLTGTLQAVLRRHVCWGFQGLDGVEAVEREPSRARKHHPPMPDSAAKSLAVNSVPETAIGIAVESTVDSTALSTPAPPPPSAARTKTASRSTPRTSGQ